MLNFNGAPVHQAAIDWASRQAEVIGVELVSDNAWAATYRLSGQSGPSYLKILPPSSRGAVHWIGQIASFLPGQVPAVLAADAQQGWLLFAAHGGRDSATDDDMVEVARSFAAIQVKAHQSSALRTALQAADVMAAPQALSEFLTAPIDPQPQSQSVGAAYFLGDEAERYAQIFRSRLPLLTPWIEAAASLPPTLCHGDLQSRNVAFTPDGQVVFFDWDEASWGPAGLCLPGLFSRCTLAAMLVSRWAASGTAGDSPPARRLEAYVNALVAGGYGDKKELLAGLIGSMSAGLMRFIVSFGRYPGGQHRADCAETLHSRLTDLLDLCDWLATRVPGAVLASVQDYALHEEWDRAMRLVQDQLSREPQSIDWLIHYAQLSCQLGDVDAAQEAAQKVLSLAPENLQARVALAHVHFLRLDVDASTAILLEILKTQPSNASAQELLAQVQDTQAVLERAAQPGAAPRLAVSAQEQRSQTLAPQTLALMLHLFKCYGAVQIDNMFAPDKIAKLQSSFAAKYGRHFHEGQHADALVVGHKRYMLTMELDDFFGKEELVASGLVLPFMEQVLGEECILSAYTAVISLPGSQQQGVHKDHSALFDESGWQFAHPSFAVQVVVPLLAMDEETGATRLYKGSQRLTQEEAAQLPFQDPQVPLGSCLVVDYAVAHCGLGNRSDKVRPILNLVYSRPWFRDARNYHLQPPLRFSRPYLDDAPESVQKLVTWWATERQVAEQGKLA